MGEYRDDSRRPVRILHIITRLIVGGAQENTIATVRGLARNPRYELTLLSGPTYGPEGSLEDSVPRDGVRFSVISCLHRNVRPVADVVCLWRLFLYIRRGRFDIVHTHSSKAGILGRWAAFLARTPLIFHTIHGLPFFPGQHPWLNAVYVCLERLSARITTKIICVAPSLVRDAQAAGIAPASRFCVIYSGMPVERFAPDPAVRAAVRDEWKIPEHAPVLGKVARLFHLKGHDFFLRAVAALRAEFPRMRAVLIGDGVLRAELEQLAETLGIRDRVIFTGLVRPDQVARYIQGIDILVHTSLREGLPRSVVQGFCCAKPAVCFDVDGAGDIVRNGINGLLVPPADQAALTQALRTLLRQPETARIQGAQGRRDVAGVFSEQRMVREIADWYERCLSDAESGGAPSE